MFAYILALKVSIGYRIASRRVYTPTNYHRFPFCRLVSNTEGHSTSEAWIRLSDSPRRLPRKAPSFIISVYRKLVVFGRMPLSM